MVRNLTNNKNLFVFLEVSKVINIPTKIVVGRSSICFPRMELKTFV